MCLIAKYNLNKRLKIKRSFNDEKHSFKRENSPFLTGTSINENTNFFNETNNKKKAFSVKIPKMCIYLNLGRGKDLG